MPTPLIRPLESRSSIEPYALALSMVLALALGADAQSSFGVNGQTLAVLGRDVSPGSVAATSDGRLRLLGFHWRGLVVLGLDATGKPDPAFGTNGRVDLPIGEGAFGSTAPAFGREIGARYSQRPGGQLAIDAQGRMVIAVRVASDGARATATAAAAPRQWALVLRLAPDGTLDATYGSGGAALIPIGWDVAAVNALVLAPDGAAFIGGSGDFDGKGACVWRVTAKGALDKGFGSKGTLRIQSWAKSVVALALGPKDLVVGLSDEFNFANVARASLRGALDKRFGNKGLVELSELGALHALALDFSTPKPRIVAAGGPGSERASGRIIRLLDSGKRDPSFAGGKEFVGGPDDRFFNGLAVDRERQGRIWALATRFHTPSTSALIALDSSGTRDPAVASGRSLPFTDRMTANVTSLQLIQLASGRLLATGQVPWGAGAVALSMWEPDGRLVGTGAAPQVVTHLPDPATVRPITDPVAPTPPPVAAPTVAPPPVKLCQYTSFKEEASTSSPGIVSFEPVFYWAPSCGGKCCEKQTASANLSDYMPSLCCVRGTEEQCGSGRWESGTSRWVTSCPSGFDRRDPVFGDPRYQR